MPPRWAINFYRKPNGVFNHIIHISFNHHVQVTFLHWQNGGFTYGEPHPLSDALKDKEFDLRIMAFEDRLQMCINGKHYVTYKLRLPLSSITHVQALSHEGYSANSFSWLDYNHRYGGFSDVSFRYISLGEKYDHVPKESGITKTGFSYCKTLYITGKMAPSLPRFQITFLRNHETRGNQYQTALIFYACWDLGYVIMNDAQNGRWGTEQHEKLPVEKVPFNLTITNESRGFVILANGKPHSIFPHRVCPYDITTIWMGQIPDLTVEVSHAANCEVPAEKTGICANSD